MRCQVQKKSGWGVKRCPYDAEEGSTSCWSCNKKAARQKRNAVATALGKPGKNEGWRDPEYREWIRGLPCLIADPSTCGSRPGRLKVEPAHVVCKAHAPDRKNLVPLCPAHHDDQEGRTKEFERFYHVSLKAEALALDTRWEGERNPT